MLLEIRYELWCSSVQNIIRIHYDVCDTLIECLNVYFIRDTYHDFHLCVCTLWFMVICFIFGQQNILL